MKGWFTCQVWCWREFPATTTLAVSNPKKPGENTQPSFSRFLRLWTKFKKKKRGWGWLSWLSKRGRCFHCRQPCLQLHLSPYAAGVHRQNGFGRQIGRGNHRELRTTRFWRWMGEELWFTEPKNAGILPYNVVVF